MLSLEDWILEQQAVKNFMPLPRWRRRLRAPKPYKYDQETERRRRQIARGQLREENGLVRE